MIDVKENSSILKKAFLSRTLEERLLELYNQGKLNGTVHTCVGQELIGAVVSEYMTENDHVVSNHRGHGHYIAVTEDVNGLMAEVMGRMDGCSGGIGGSQHLCNDRFLSNGIQGGMTPIAAGIALSNKLRNNQGISIAFIGDGTLGEGILYEAMNLASIWKVPLLIVLENNGYAQSTSFKQTFSGSVEARVQGFGLDYYKTNTWDLEDLKNTMKDAVSSLRKGSGPAFVEVTTYRLNSHSKGDDNRASEEVAEFIQKDLLNQLKKSESLEVQQILGEAKNLIDEAVAFGEASPFRTPLTTEGSDRMVTYANMPVLEEEDARRINELIYEQLKEHFTNDPSAMLIGEDIEWKSDETEFTYGGAFKVTRDLSDLFKGRVRNTPISEQAITGIGTGLALAGHKSIVEIMFGDFMTLTLDQLLQHATKFERMFDGKVKVPLIVRTPMGGKRGYGPTHSQSLEKYFFGIPNLHIIALNGRVAPGLLYQEILSDISHPHLVVENKVLYTRKLDEDRLPGFDYQLSDEKYPTLRVGAEDPEISVFCYGEMHFEAEAAVLELFETEELVCEIICPTQVYPVNIEPFIDSAMKTGKVLVLEEGSGEGAWGSEVLARLLERGVVLKKVKRLNNNSVIPCSLDAELKQIPNRKNILESLNQLI